MNDAYVWLRPLSLARIDYLGVVNVALGAAHGTPRYRQASRQGNHLANLQGGVSKGTDQRIDVVNL